MNKCLFLNHEWEKVKLIIEYFDYSGYKVGVFQCKCKNCGKTKNRKFY